MAKDPYRYFRIEANELSDQLAKGVLDLEKGSFGAELVARLLRQAHTLKGAARVVKQTAIADLAHSLEDTLSPYRAGLQAIPREHVDQALATLDAINLQLVQLPTPAGETVGADANADTSLPVSDGALRIVRSDLVEVDAMLEGLGEIGSELGGMRRGLDMIERSRNLAAQLSQQQSLPQAKLKMLGEEIHALLSRIDAAIAGGMLRIDRELRDVRDAAERLRLVPISSIFNALERTVRDAAYSTGKQVVFEARAGQLRIDGSILDVVQSALIQLLRNAVAHGIETPAQRERSGKPPGAISIDVERRGYRACFRCKDDGAGVDLDGVRRALHKKGVPASETGQLDADGLMALLLKGGVSTTSVVTEISGRGVGLDLVREAMLQLDGDISASSVAGQGTVIELIVPLSLAALDVLMVEQDNQLVALPLDAVRCTLRVTPPQLVHTAQGKTILYEGRQIPIAALHLGAAIKAPRAASVLSGRAQTAVVVRSADGIAALTVDRLCGMETVVLRALPAACPVDALVLGVYLDDGGDPRMVLDPDVQVARSWSGAASRDPTGLEGGPRATQLPILIIDDSLTTRMLESSILESAGYTVALAVCAEDGWAMAQQARYSLFLVDVEMPGMDGFTFVKNTQADPALRLIPSILISSRDAIEDRQKGLDSGARAYIVKGEFDQIEFLNLISELVQ